MTDDIADTSAPVGGPRPFRWLGDAVRRLSLSFCLSILLHALIATAVVVVLLHGGKNPTQQQGEISVALISSDVDDAGSAPEPDRDGDRDREAHPGTPSVAEQAEQRLLDQHDRQLADIVGKIESAADETAWAEAEKAIEKAEKAYRQRRVKRASDAFRQLDKSSAEWRKLEKRLAGLKARVKESRSGAFYGIPSGSARKIVYVVDRSTSMTNELGAVKRELKRAISTLTEGKSFHVIFYDSGPPTEMPPRGLVQATSERKQAAYAFINRIAAGGGTEPAPALDRALDLKPDVIYLLSDGQFPESAVARITGRNAGKGTAINTICFQNRSGETLLRKLAASNSGTYVFVAR
ncbi:hypothetical protein LCGC14_1561480 [marine sediment metagenome]|uniref:VWFA domain-containing protein n=1 Tax=marine sediment metagenome TaxID=412755 RepID=A0A0F9LN23_9ZZZZ